MRLYVCIVLNIQLISENISTKSKQNSNKIIYIKEFVVFCIRISISIFVFVFVFVFVSVWYLFKNK